MKNLTNIYEIADENNIEVFSFGLKNNEALSHMDNSGDCYIAIDSMVLSSEQNEKMKVSHEIGHCVTGSFYSQYTPLTTRGMCEAKALHWQIKELIDYDELIETMKSGYTDGWELAEYFDVPCEFMYKAIEYYQAGNR